MTTNSKIIPNNRETREYTVSAIKVIIETHIAARNYYNYPKRIIEKTITKAKTETMSKINVT